MTNRTSIYIENKYTKIYFQIIEKAKSSNIIGYAEKHHIIPRSFGGSDDKSNLVKLTARQHYICHLLLTKMVEYNSPEYHKMIKAYMMMAWYKGDNQDRSYKINSRIFDNLKVEFSKVQSIQQSGEKNSQFGMMWVYNPVIKENKKINKNDDIPDGWVKGKVGNWNTHYTQIKCVVCGKQGLSSNKSRYCSNVCRMSNKPLKTDKALIDHIYDKCVQDNDCLLWQKSVTSSGYPQFHYDGKNIQVHRYMYEYKNNITVQHGYILKHKCQNIKCVNPDHIFIITSQENYKMNDVNHKRTSSQRRNIWNVNEVHYKTIREASDKTGLSQSSLCKYTINGIFDVEQYRIGCRKANVKPKI